MNRRPTVLVVDDDTETRATLEAVLSARGVDVQLARDGVEAIDVLEATCPDLVLLDLCIPGILGPSVAVFMGAERRLASVPIVIMTGSPELAPAGYPLLRKPFRVAELLAVLEPLLEIALVREGAPGARGALPG